jgi:hypothetical protein
MAWMPLPVTLAIAYLALNLAVMIWLERERSGGRSPTLGVSAFALGLRFGPPVAGVLYLITIAGDWLFFGFVLAFFAASFWLMDGLLAFTGPGGAREPMRSGWDDRAGHAGQGPDGDEA